MVTPTETGCKVLERMILLSHANILCPQLLSPPKQKFYFGKCLTAYNIQNSHINIKFSPSLQEVYNADKSTQKYCIITEEDTYSTIPNISKYIAIIPVDAIPINIRNNTFPCTLQRYYSYQTSLIAKTFKEFMTIIPE